MELPAVRFVRLTTTLVFLAALAGTADAMSDAPAGHVIIATVTRPHVVATLSFGDQADHLAAVECDEGECIAGFGMAGPEETVYFYDYGHKNIKVISTHSGTLGPQEVIQGVDLNPDDGTVLSDGTIYLLVDRWGNSLPIEVERYAIYQRSPQIGRWEELPPLVEEDFGIQPDGINIYNSVFIEPARRCLHLRQPRCLRASRDLQGPIEGPGSASLDG